MEAGIDDTPQHYLREVGHFFEIHKALEGARTTPVGWEGIGSAYDRIEHSTRLYREHCGRGVRI
jgi:inorganic pyrophosphatase